MSRNIGFTSDINGESPTPVKYPENVNYSGGEASLNRNQPPPPYIQAVPPPVRLPPIQQNQNQQPIIQDVGRNANNANGEWGQIGRAGGLSDKNIRIRFIRKVYLIVTALLIYTFGVVAVFVFVKPVNDFAKTTAGLILYIVSAVLFFILVITFAICSCTKGLRRVPFNYIILVAIASTMAVMLGFVSAYHSIQAVIIAVGITLLITGGVTLVATQTKFDFTKNCWLVAICLTFALIGFGIACIFVRNNILQAVYGGLGAVVMSIYLAIDTQMIVGGKKYQFSEEDYANAALQLYLDICYIFMYILQAFGNK